MDRAPNSARHALGGGLREGMCELASKERVPLAASVHLGCPSLSVPPARHRRHQVADILGVETAKLDVVGACRELTEDGGGSRAQLVMTMEADQQHAGPGTEAGEEVQQLEGGGVRPLQVVEDDHDGTVVAAADQPPSHGIEEPQSCAPRILLGAGRLRTKRGDDAGQQPAIGLGNLDRIGSGSRSKLAEGLGPRPVPGCPGPSPADPEPDVHPGRPTCSLRHQRAFPDARLPTHQHQRGATGAGSVHGGRQQ